MLKQKSKGNSPLLNSGQPTLEEIKVAPVDDLLTEMQAASDAAVAALNAKNELTWQQPDLCTANCPCGPCRDGNCRMCSMEGRRGRRDRYDRDGRGQDQLAEEWVRAGGEWDRYANRPYFRNQLDEHRWEMLQQLVREREYEYQRRFRIPFDGEIYGKW